MWALGRRHGYFFSRLVLVAAVAVAPLLALRLYELVRQKRVDEESVMAMLQSRVERSTIAWDAAVSRVERLVEVLTENRDLKTLNPARCELLIRNLAHIDPILANIGAVDLQGRLLCLAQQPNAPAPSYEKAAWFAPALASTASSPWHVSQPYLGDVSKKWLVNVVAPLHDDGGKRVGMIAVAVDLTYVSTRLLSVNGLPPGSVMGLVNAEGRFIAREPDLSNFVGTAVAAPIVAAANANRGRAFRSRFVDGTEAVTFASEPLRFGIRIGAASPLSEVQARGAQDFVRSLVVSLLALAAGAIAAAFVARRLASPLRSLAQSARSQAAGDNNARADEAVPGEFRELALEFNAMLDARRAGEASQRAQMAAEAASRAKSEFLANMSHEIRTPMNAIVGLTDLALRSPLTAQQSTYLRKSQQAADSLLHLIDQILDFSKIEARKLQLEQREFSLDEVLDRVTIIVGQKARQKGLELLVGVGRDLPVQLVGDAQRLTQVLVNLCGNAVKFTESGEIVVTVARIADSGDQVVLRFSVRDTGIGMSEEQTSRLFQPFTQADESTSRRYGGTGLGLSISRQLVELMGGAIEVRSHLGQGSEFIFTVRLACEIATTGPVADIELPLQGVRVLVVDDSEAARTLLTDQLERLGCQVETAESGEVALRQLAASGARAPDLALVDWRMPGLDGFQTARQLRALDVRPAHIVMISAGGDESVARRAHEEGLDGSLGKPINASMLLDTLASLLGRQLPPSDAQPRATPSDDAAVMARLRGRRVLVVEDNEVNQIVASDLLSSAADVEVDVAGSGAEAIERVGARRYDAVLMDVQMPVMDGFEATRRIRANFSAEKLPVIAMTAHATARDREACLGAGMNDYVTKPFAPAHLFAVLARWLGPRVDPLNDLSERGLSVELGLSRCLGRHDLYAKVGRRYLQGWKGMPQSMREALAKGEPDQVAFMAHSLVSTASTIGALALSEMARALQLSIEAGEQDEWTRLVDAIDSEGTVVSEALRVHLASRSEGEY